MRCYTSRMVWITVRTATVKDSKSSVDWSRIFTEICNEVTKRRSTRITAAGARSRQALLLGLSNCNGTKRLDAAEPAGREQFLEFRINDLGQPVGMPVTDWTPPERPARQALAGRFCRVEPLDVSRHADSLYEFDRMDLDGRTWTYLPYGPFPSVEAYRNWAELAVMSTDPLFFAIVENALGRAVGLASYLRITPASGTIEIGHLHFSPRLQRSSAATEALYLMMDWALRNGYRRLEWKCDALNAPSRRAAQRLGLSYEGIFRQATVVKGRNRDTAWYSVLDWEWPGLSRAFARWLDPVNFDPDGRQVESLSALTAPLLKHRG